VCNVPTMHLKSEVCHVYYNLNAQIQLQYTFPVQYLFMVQYMFLSIAQVISME